MEKNFPGSLALIDPTSGRVRETLVAPGMLFSAVAFTPDGQQLVACDARGKVARMGIGSGDAVRVLDVVDVKLPEQRGLRAAVVAAGEPRLAVAAGRDVLLYTPFASPEPRRLTGHDDAVNALCFSPDGTLLATGSADTTVLLWRTAPRPSR